jgi:hypothetical protein
MARIHRATIYIVDPNEEYRDINDIINNIENKLDIRVENFFARTTEDFEWYDEINVNYSNVSMAELEEYFD